MRVVQILSEIEPESYIKMAQQQKDRSLHNNEPGEAFECGVLDWRLLGKTSFVLFEFRLNI